MAEQTTWDTGNWDSGTWDSTLAPTKSIRMNAKVALNIKALKPREKLAKFQTGITKCGATPVLPNPTPSLLVCQSSHDAAKTILDSIDTKETELTNLRIQRDQVLDVAMGNYSALGSCVESASLGDPAFIAGKGYDVASDPTPLPDVGRVTNLVLTHGDHDGLVDASWNRDRSARSYEVQTSTDPMSATSWVANQIATRSGCTINGQALGTKLWVRVRAIGTGDPGDWSDPAFIIVA
jgi:hypothetical protein